MDRGAEPLSSHLQNGTTGHRVMTRNKVVRTEAPGKWPGPLPEGVTPGVGTFTQGPSSPKPVPRPLSLERPASPRVGRGQVNPMRVLGGLGLSRPSEGRGPTCSPATLLD